MRPTTSLSPLTTIYIALLLSFLSPSSSSSSPFPGSLQADIATLLAFKNSSAITTQNLATWHTKSNPCNNTTSWLGVTCSSNRVTKLILENLNLSGPSGLQILTQLNQLRVLSLKSNQLSGPIPDISSLRALKLLFLSHNRFSGPIPPSIANLTRLYRLDLSSNNLSGPVPVHLNRLTRLLTLRLDSNQLTGSLSALFLPHLQDLNVSSNRLSGELPPALAVFPASSFSGNPGLCGGPMPACASVTSSPVPPVTSSPTTKPEVAAAAVGSGPQPAATGEGRKSGKMGRWAVALVVAGDFAALLAVSGVLFCYFWRKFGGRNASRLREGEKIVYSSSPYLGVGGIAGGEEGAFGRGKMVFFEGMRRFEVEELLRASAEMLGKGNYGTAYRAVLDDGSVVAVKRLREFAGGSGTKREFEGWMEVLGRLRHANVVELKAYYFANDEKLLVYDYMPNGSLFSLLHGNRGPGRMALDWRTRLKFAVGAARGLAFIHQFSKSPKLSHGNVKSTNILIDKDGNARLADCGLALLGPAASMAGKTAGGYRAPEAPTDGRRPWATQKADVYAFGLVLLELLTGKPVVDGTGVVDLPRWVQSVVREEWTAEVFDLELMRYKGIEEEMVAVLQIAMSCAALSPDQRPKIGNVVKMLEDVSGDGSGRDGSPSHESMDTVSDSPSVSDDATVSASR